MTTINESYCSICQDPMPLQGVMYRVNQLFPGRQVKQLDPCKHQFHSGCFQSYVNRHLAPIYDHKGPVPCPNCRNETEQEHSMVHFYERVPPESLIKKWVTGISVGIGCVVAWMANKYLFKDQPDESMAAWLLNKCLPRDQTDEFMRMAKLISIIAFAAILGDSLTKYGPLSLRIMRLFYSLKFGVYLERKDIVCGKDSSMTIHNILDVYCDLLPAIDFYFDQGKFDEEGQPLYLKKSFSISSTRRGQIIDAMKHIINRQPKDTSPPEFEEAKAHFFPMIVNDDSKNPKRGNLFEYLTSIAREAKAFEFPENGILSHINYDKINYSHIKFTDWN